MPGKNKFAALSRRTVLQTSGAALAGITALSGSAVADSSKGKTQKWSSFDDLLKDWESRFGELSDKRIIDGTKENDLVVISSELEFKDGTIKEIEYRYQKEANNLFAIADSRTFVKQNPSQLMQDGPTVKSASSETTGFSTMAAGTQTGDGQLPASKTISDPPVITPGDNVSGSSGNSSQSWKNGFGIERVTKDESNFRAEAYCSGAFITYGTQAGAQVWYEFKVANESPISTPSVKISFDWWAKAHTAVGGGSADVVAEAFFHDAYYEDIDIEHIFNKSSDVGDYWNKQKDGTASFQKEVRPGGIYRFGVHIDTTATAIYTAVAKADVQEDKKEIDIGNFDITWT